MSYVGRKEFIATRDAYLAKKHENPEELESTERTRVFLHMIEELGISREEALSYVLEGPSGISQLNKKLGLEIPIPFREFVAYIETSLTETKIDPSEEYREIFETQLAIGRIKQRTLVDRTVEPRDLEFIMYNQSPSRYRSVVELTSNSIDFSEKGDVISVYTDTRGYMIIDRGKGMSIEEIFTKLLPPLMSGARDVSTKSIGRFGLGFYTIGDHLKNDGDFVILTTSSDPNSPMAARFKLQNIDGELFIFPFTVSKELVSKEINEAYVKGTIIEVSSEDGFNPTFAEDSLIDHMRYKRGIPIILNGEQINSYSDEEDVIIEDNQQQGAVIVKGLNKQLETNAFVTNTATILVNGVLIYRIPTHGSLSIAVDFPFDTRLSESRDLIIITRKEFEFLKSIIDSIFSTDISDDNKAKIINQITDLALHLEQNNSTYRPDIPLTRYIANRCVEYFRNRNKLTLVPDSSLGHSVDVEDSIYLNPKLECVELKKLPLFTRIFEYSSADGYLLYTAKLNPDTPPIQRDGKFIVIDTKTYEAHRNYPILLELYIDKLLMTEAGEFVNRYDKLRVPGLIRDFDLKSKVIPKWEEELLALSYSIIDLFELDKERKRALLHDYSYLFTRIFNPSGSSTYLTDEQHTPVDTLELNNSIIEQKSQLIPEIQEDFYILKIEVVERLVNSTFEEALETLWQWLQNTYKNNPGSFRDSHRAVLNDESIELHVALQEFINARYFDKNGEPLEYEERENSQYLIADTCSRILKGILDLLEFNKAIKEIKEQGLLDVLEKCLQIMRYSDGSGQLNMQEVKSMALILKKDPISASKIIDHYYSKFEVLHPIYLRSRMMFMLSALVNPPISYLADADSAYTKDINWLNKSATPPSESQILNLSETGSMHSRDNFFLYFRKQYLRNYGYFGGDMGMFPASEVDSFEKFARFVTKRHKQLVSNLDTVIATMENLLAIPTISRIYTGLNLEIHSLLYNEFNSRYDRNQNTLVSYANLIDFLPGFISGLNTNQLNAIERIVNEKFDIDEFGKREIVILNVFLKRCLFFADFEDDLFEYSLPLFFSGAMLPRDAKLVETSLNITPPFLNKKYIEYCKKLKIPSQNLEDLFKLIFKLYTKGNKGERTFEVYFKRLAQIWADISRLSDAQYSRLFKSFLMSFGVRKYSRDIGYFEETVNIIDVPEMLRPYIIHFREGGNIKSIESENATEPKLNTMEDYSEISLARLIAARRFLSRNFWEKSSDPSELADWITTETSDMNMAITNRAVLHAIFKKSLDPNVYLRELIENACDVMKDHPEYNGEIYINESQIGSNYVVEIEDPVGMDTQTVLGYLLAVEYSTKKDDSGLAGKFGIGFMSIFQDAEKVVIATAKNGFLTTVLAEPVYNEDNVVIDINLKVSRNPTTTRGTRISRWTKRDATSLQKAFTKTAVTKYAVYIDYNQARIFLNGEQVNDNIETYSTIETDLGVFRVRSGAGRVITQNGIFVMQIPDSWYLNLGSEFHKLFLSTSFVIDIPNSIPLTRGGNKIAKQEEFLPFVREIFTREVMKNFILRFSNGEVPFDLLPYDYFWESSRLDASDESIQKDANEFNSTGEIPDLAKYANNISKLFYLLAAIRVIEIDGIKYSLQMIARTIQSGGEIEADKLPETIRGLVSKGKYQITSRASLRNKAEKEETFITGDFSPTPEMIEILERKRMGALIFLIDIWETFTTYPNALHTIYHKPDKSIAHASRVGIKGLNWYQGYVSYFLTRLSATPNVRSLKDAFKLFMDVSSHEDAHLHEGSDSTIDLSYTHGEQFREIQLRVIEDLIRTWPNLKDVMEEKLKQHDVELTLHNVEEVIKEMLAIEK